MFRINGPPVGPPPPKLHFGPELPHVGALLFVNAIKVTVIEDQVLAKGIEIPVIPQPTLSVTVTLGEGENIPLNASGYVRLLDVSEPGAESSVLSSRVIREVAAFPIPFRMIYHPADIDPSRDICVGSRVKEVWVAGLPRSLPSQGSLRSYYRRQSNR